eukprot:TRINITY_DN504_c0_g2_i1.p1 TRINITY_DN504_c0_g2~~TRINITY_DN504_c0_g2_i1.p1  ORF type:complete len:396 (+),score=74.92 TRINITY_DN504_c0_g2_i1:124-1311(+)
MRSVHTVSYSILKQIRRQALQQQGRGDAGEGLSIAAATLADCWVQAAAESRKLQGLPEITDRDKEFIEVRVWQSLREVETDRKSVSVDLDEWLHHMLLTRSNPRTMKAVMQLNLLLEEAMAECPGILVGLQHALEVAELDGYGSRAASEVLRVFSGKVWHLRARKVSKSGATDSPRKAYCSGSLDDFVSEMYRALTLDGIVHVARADFLSLALGRPERQVSLNLYDLSWGAASLLSPLLAKEGVDGVWHTGVVVFDREYYFGGNIFFDEPGQTTFGKPVKVLPLGTTLRRLSEFQTFLVDELKPAFSKDTYDTATNNCNHFTDRVAMYLCGKHIPDDILSQPETMLNTGLGRAVAPILNKCMGIYFEPSASTRAVDLPVAGFDGDSASPLATYTL